METKSKVGLLVLGAAVVAVAGLIIYTTAGEDKLRPATPDEVAKYLPGAWSGVAVGKSGNQFEIFKFYEGLKGNRVEGKGGTHAKTPCPNYVIAGSVEGNRIQEENSYTDVPDGAPSYCRRQGRTKYEMKIAEDGTAHLVGSWDVGEFSGTSELTRVR